jgi:hypothetical protein
VEAAYVADGSELDWRVSESIPDLLIHEPGPHTHNLAVIEAKLAEASGEEIQWDLAKLALFSSQPLNYDMRIFLLICQGSVSPDDALTQVRSRAMNSGVRIDVATYSPENQAVKWDSVAFEPQAAIELFEEAARKALQRRGG